jgi:glycosyltransferase involved in cell wall biosynthesis
MSPEHSPSTLSILMPVRNAAATLDEAVRSIVAQTWADWELITVDDGSTDATPRLLEAWQREDARVHVVRQSSGEGIVAALNTALQAARGAVIARMDADDIALPERLERQRERLLAPDAPALVGCGVRYFPEEIVADGARRYEEWINSLITPEEHARDIFVECPLAHPTFMMQRAALEAVGGYQARGWPEDYDLALRFWRVGYRIAKVPEVLLRWREAPERTSRVHGDYRPDAFRRCKVHHLRRSYLAGGRPALVWGAGPIGKAFARALLEAGHPLRGFVELNPRKIGMSIYGAPVLSDAQAFPLRGTAFGLAAVGQPGARERIRGDLTREGWVEGEDFCCVA